MPYFILFLSLSFSLFLSSTLISFCVSLFLSVPPPSLSIFTLCFNAYLTRYLSLLLSACVFIKIKCFVSLKTLIVRNHSLVDRGGVFCIGPGAHQHRPTIQAYRQLFTVHGAGMYWVTILRLWKNFRFCRNPEPYRPKYFELIGIQTYWSRLENLGFPFKLSV